MVVMVQPEPKISATIDGKLYSEELYRYNHWSLIKGDGNDVKRST